MFLEMGEVSSLQIEKRDEHGVWANMDALQCLAYDSKLMPCPTK